MVTLDDLYAEANRFLWDTYGLTLEIPIDIEDEFLLEQGAYEHTAKEPRRILIADYVLEIAHEDVVYDVLRHELVHYALHRKKKPFADGCSYFERELRQLGIGNSGQSVIGRFYMYACECCGGELPSPLPIPEEDRSRVVTACCGTGFISTGKQAVYDGKGRIY